MISLKSNGNVVVVFAKIKTDTENMLISNTIRKRLIEGLFSFVVILGVSIFFTDTVEAAGLTQAYVRLDRLTASIATSGMVCAKSTTVAVETMVKVTFPTGFTTTDTPGNWTVTTTNIPTDATAWIGIGTATAATGQDVTFPSGDMVVGTLYCFNFTGTSTLTNAGAGNNLVGVLTTQLAGPTTIDSSSFALSTITNDQIAVSATVPPTFSFSLPTNTLTFLSNLTTTPVLTGTSVATITTNASSGWVAWVKSANAALNSASTGATIASPGSASDNTVTDVSATNGYFLDVAFTDSGTGTGTVSQAANYGQEYNGDATHGGTLSTTFQPVAASSGTTDGDTITLTALAKISAVQAAATDYADTLTVVAAGRF